MIFRRASSVVVDGAAFASLALATVSCNTFDDPPSRETPTAPSPAFPTVPVPFPTVTAPTLGPRAPCGTISDQDGDGVNGVDRAGCDADSPWPIDVSVADCDDFDATQHQAVRYGLDADGDGYGGPIVQWLCEGTESPGLSPNTTDCDDTNPYAQAYLYVDADGDGRGAATDLPACEAADLAGFAPNSADCDDADPAVYEGATGESAYDGVDTDCDGYDVPWVHVESVSELEPFSESPWCEGPVLAITALVSSGDLSDLVVLQVTNVGTSAVSGASVVIEQLGSDKTVTSTARSGIPELAAGGVFLYHLHAAGTYQAAIVYDLDGEASGDVDVWTSNPAASSGVNSQVPDSDGQVSAVGADAAASSLVDAAVDGGTADEAPDAAAVDIGDGNGDAGAPDASVPTSIPEAGAGLHPVEGGPRCELLQAPLLITLELDSDPVTP